MFEYKEWNAFSTYNYQENVGPQNLAPLQNLKLDAFEDVGQHEVVQQGYEQGGQLYYENTSYYQHIQYSQIDHFMSQDIYSNPQTQSLDFSRNQNQSPKACYVYSPKTESGILDPNSISLYPEGVQPQNSEISRTEFSIFDNVDMPILSLQKNENSSDSDSTDSEGRNTPKDAPKVSRRSKEREVPLDITPIDTLKLSQEILQALEAQKISQKLFAQKILGRSQGTLSDLLNHPKKWENLKNLGKSTYVKLQNWMDLSEGEKWDSLQGGEEERGALKEQKNGKRSHPNDTSMTPPAAKKVRMTFTKSQKDTLTSIYNVNPHPSPSEQKKLAQELELDVSTVSNFFMNSRRRGFRQSVNKKFE